jgi:amino acid permease
LKKKYPQILMKAIFFDLTLFISFAIICYWTYRDDVIQPIFTMSLVPIDSMVIFIYVCVCINALTSYPIQILAAFSIIESFTLNNHDSHQIAKLKKFSLRALIIIMTTIVCMVVKTFTDFINIAGALGSVTVAFILPQMFYFRTYGNELSYWQKLGCYLIATFGICGGTYSIYYSIEKLARGDLS